MLVVFDLDGTLVDSLRDIAEATNDCLELLGREPRRVQDYRYMVGEGVPALCRKACAGEPEWLVNRLTELVRARYRTALLRHTAPYSGVDGLVRALHGRGARLGVLSNKPHDMTVRIVRAFWQEAVFEQVHGFEPAFPRKPDPARLVAMMAVAGASGEQTWMVGDTPVDVETARRAGARSLSVTWGFRSREDLLACGAERLCDSPDEALAALEAAAASGA